MNFMKSTWCLHKILALRIRELNHHQIPHITLRTGRNWCFFAKIAEVQCFLNYAKHSHCCVASSAPKQQNIPNPSKETTKDSEDQSITIIIVYIYMCVCIISFVYICVYHCISHISEHVLHYISMQGAYNHHQKHHFFVAAEEIPQAHHRTACRHHGQVASKRRAPAAPFGAFASRSF